MTSSENKQRSTLDKRFTRFIETRFIELIRFSVVRETFEDGRWRERTYQERMGDGDERRGEERETSGEEMERDGGRGRARRTQGRGLMIDEVRRDL